MSAPDLSEPLRTALLGQVSIIGQLPSYNQAPAVFTRRPAPADAPYPMIFVSADVTSEDFGGIDNTQLVILRDIAVYGRNDTPAEYRLVEAIAYEVREFLHNNRHGITITGWSVVNLTCTGPRMAPTDDDYIVGRVVSLTAHLARLDA